ncbi:xyloglucanase [Pontibacter sp. E15-1]|uniref:xyloglucanase n=1 Tax=Pontibacter sp. E15-1 TaxID=2919918 RepID=UPI001F4F421B|nr:xyloglucanase [Pontibacter sp. E15-1]MCJ8165874.1 xyloglucanase [Pontibacter sp. E15-1]
MNKLFAFLLSCFVLLVQPSAEAQDPAAYTWKNVQIQGGGFVTGVEYHPTAKDVAYARTDVGGAYRWNALTETWVPMTDHLGRGQENYTGVLSLATDPADPSRVYLATGLYTQSWAGTGAVLASTDKGVTWTQANLPIKLGGNEDGRSAGERLQVDPNLGRILYLGSSTDGLWKSSDYGATWAKVSSFPVSSSPVGSGGISFVHFDKASGTSGSATPTLYVGVLKQGTNLYKSTDGGGTWAAVPGQPTTKMPQHAQLAADGTLYLTYTNAPGPNNITDGAVWKLNTAAGNWTDISPPAGQGGYAGLALDPQKPGTLLVSTMDRWWPRDEVFYSSNGGGSWKPLLSTATFDHSLAPYAAASTPHWVGDVALDPFDSDKAWFVTGYGVFQTVNLTAAAANLPINWKFQNRGLEETVPLQLISPPEGAPLLSALGDIDGFRHESLDASPATGRLAPSFGTNTSIAFAALKPAIIARTHNIADGRYGAHSADGGNSWSSFGTFPAGTTGGGSIAVSADGAILVWTPGGVSGMFYSRNQGGSWSSATGVAKAGLRPVADRVSSNTFYLYDAEAGKVLVSTNGGASFAVAASCLPQVPSWLTWAANLKSVDGSAGELWLTIPGQGLYRSSNSGASFAKQAQVQDAVNVGFGKPAPGKTYPAVYLAGKIAQVNGFYRSDDAGGTWLRIDDAQHQFGGVNDITGDPRHFGRVYIATSGRGIVYGDAMGVVSGLNDAPEPAVTFGPNPFRGALQLRTEGAATYTITSLLGSKLEAGTCKDACAVGGTLPAGVYLLRIRQQERTKTVRIVKY